MFKNKKTLLIAAVVVSLVIIAGFTLNNVLNDTKTALARQADVILTAPTTVPNNSTTPTSLYFTYGSPNSDLDIINAIGALSTNNSNFTVVSSSIQDLYFGSPLRTDAQNPPAQPTCDSSYTGPVYALLPSLATTSSFTYGLQSARNSSAASGSASAGALPGGQNGLREKASGCIKVDFLVTPGVAVGSTTIVTFDQDSTLSTSYQEARRPGLQRVTLTAGTATSTSGTATSGTATSTSGTATATSGTATSTSTSTSGTATATSTSGTATSGTATATSGTATATSGTATATSGTATSTSASTSGTATSTSGTATATSGTATSTSGTTTSTATGTTVTPRTGGNSVIAYILTISFGIIAGTAFYLSRKSKLNKKVNIS